MIPLRDTQRTRSKPVVTWLIVIANALVFLFELSLPEDELERFLWRFGLVPRRFVAAIGEGGLLEGAWPVLTGMFLHGGWLHVISNMWSLWIFGDNVEDRLGPSRFLFFYLACGVAAGLLHLGFNADSPVPAIGASGAIGGVMGAYLVLFPHAKVLTLVPIFVIATLIEVPAFVFLILWFLLQFLSGAVSAISVASEAGGIAWWAHVGGFLAGVVLGPTLARRSIHGRRRAR